MDKLSERIAQTYKSIAGGDDWSWVTLSKRRLHKWAAQAESLEQTVESLQHENAELRTELRQALNRTSSN